MNFKICFDNTKEKINNFFKLEKININDNVISSLLSFLSKACTYEEEGKKIKPELLIGSNISEFLKMVSPKHQILIHQTNNYDEFNKILKSLLPFCNNGWTIYIDIIHDSFDFGICKAMSSIYGFSISEILFSDDIYIIDGNSGIAKIDIINSFGIKLTGIRKNNLLIDFRLNNEININLEVTYKNIAEDIAGISEIKEKLINVYKKIFKLIHHNVHGTICVVVNNNYIFPNKFISDGIWLPKPLNISEKAKEIINDKFSRTSEEFYNLTYLFIEMLNIDGITAIDNTGSIRGYNLFVNQSKLITTGGGARKRAAEALLSNEHENIIGVYFQSQDGDIYYKRRK